MGPPGALTKTLGFLFRLEPTSEATVLNWSLSAALWACQLLLLPSVPPSPGPPPPPPGGVSGGAGCILVWVTFPKLPEPSPALARGSRPVRSRWTCGAGTLRFRGCCRAVDRAGLSPSVSPPFPSLGAPFTEAAG